MMNQFLQDFLITMPGTQRQKLLELLELKQKQGLIRSEDEFKRELERLMAEMEKYNGTPTFMPIYQQGRTNSQAYNQNLDAIAFDLSTLFDASNQIERLIADNHQISRSLLADARKKIYTLKAQVDRYKLLMNHSDGFVDAIHEDFKTPQYTENEENKLQVLRKDRYGQPLSNIYNAENYGHALQLAGIETTDQLKTNYGRVLAKIEVRNRTGLEASNNKYKVENAIDGSPDTFWAEAIIVDDVIQQNIDDLWSHDYHDYPKSGAICELEITLNGLTTVSEIHFDPYCAHPLEVVAIHGYETTDNGGKMYSLISPNHPNIYQRSQKSVDRMVFQFPSVEISKLRILLRQENYVKENFIVSYDDLHNMEMWDRLASDEKIIPDFKEPGESMAEFDRKNEITGWKLYLEKLIEWATILRKEGLVEAAKKAMEIIQMGDYKNPLLLALRSINKNGEKEIVQDPRSPLLSQQWLATNKLVYVYGAYNISVFGRKYHRNSIYVSKPLPLSSNISRISLSTKEKHHDIQIGGEEIDPNTKQLIQHTARITDIEYYVTFKKNPLPSDWKPILPVEKKFVQGELLLGDDIDEEYPEFEGLDLITFTFRFPVVSKDTVTIRRNGYPMLPHMYIISDNGKKVGIKREYYSPSSIYTADYKPVDSAYTVIISGENGIQPTQFVNENGEIGEKFQTVDHNNCVELKHYPYLFRKVMFQYNKDEGRYDEDSSTYNSNEIYYPIIVRVKGVEYKNITDYATNSYDPERLKENGGRTFAHIGKKIIFGKPENGEKLEDIVVDYHYITTDIRLKAILRRNHAGYESVTPALYSYQLRCQSFDQEV
jgi:hypothetical protein